MREWWHRLTLEERGYVVITLVAWLIVGVLALVA